MAAEQPPRIYFWDGELPTLKVVGILDGDPQFMRLGGAGLPPQARARSWKHGAGRSDWWTAVSLGESGPEFCGLSDDRLTRVWAGRWNGPLNGGESWFGAAYDLARLGGDTLEKIELGDSLNGPQIVALCGNREGGIWFGSEEDGLHFLQEKLVRTFSTEDGLSGNDVRSVCAGPDGAIWVTTDRGLDRVQEGIVSHRGDAVGNMRSVGVDQSGGLWFSRGQFGTMALRRDWLEKLGHWVLLGLNWQDPNTIRFGRDGKVWVTCERGLTWVRPELLVQTNGNWVADPKHAGSVFGRYAVGKELPNIVPLGLVEDRDGSMWMGSLDKGGLFHLKEGRFERFDEKDGLPGQHWTPVLVDPAGALWVTAEGGLARRKEGRFQAVTPKEGLPKDWLLDMTEDDLGNFWISGKRGIHRVSKAELDEVLLGRTNSIRALSLGSREGMRTTECSSKHFPGIAKTPDGQIWVPTRDGLVRFDPRRVRLNTQPLEAFVDQLLAGKKREWNINTTGRAQTHELAPGAGERVEVHFTAISLAAADRIQFRYWLEGYDSDWSVPTDLRLAFYTNLRPGSYRFHVKAANSHGIWSDDEGILDFRILPYFWQTRSFYCGLASLALGLVAAFHLYRLNLQKRGQQMQMRQMLLDEKTRIAADMHDQLGATLTQIVILGEVAKSQAQRGVETYPLLDRISQAARDVTTGMSELVWATNPRNDTLENMAAYLREMAAGQLQDSGMTARLDFPASVPDAYVSATIRRNLVLILKEALHNAIKHSAASEVEVILALGGGELGLTVKDNGRGFSSDERTDRGNGLRNMQKRVADIGGVFRVESQAGHGTAIKVVVPLRSAGILPREEGNP